MPGKRKQVVVGNSLVPEQQHVVAIPRVLDRIDLVRRDAREIDTFHFGAEASDGNHFQISYHGHSSLLPIAIDTCISAPGT
jgi:hypothetical protein